MESVPGACIPLPPVPVRFSPLGRLRCTSMGKNVASRNSPDQAGSSPTVPTIALLADSPAREWLKSHINLEAGIGRPPGSRERGAPTLDRIGTLLKYFGSPEVEY